MNRTEIDEAILLSSNILDHIHEIEIAMSASEDAMETGVALECLNTLKHKADEFASITRYLDEQALLEEHLVKEHVVS